MEVAASDLAGTPIAYGTAKGHRRWLRIEGIADLSWTDEGESLEVAPYDGVDSAQVRDQVETIGIPLYLQASRGYEALHASAVATSSGVTAFCGTSGSGKSTIARVLALRGRPLWADDVLAFDADSKKAVATALPFEPKLRPASRAFLRRPAGRALAKDTDVELVAPWTTERVGALFVVDRLDSTCEGCDFELNKLTAGNAIAALLQHGIRFKPLELGREQRILRAYLNLVATTPVFRVAYRPGFASFPALIGEIETVMHQLNSRAG